MTSCTLNAGRLLEVRLAGSLRTAAEVDAFFDAIGRELGKLPVTRRVVIAADWRGCQLMSSEASEHARLRLSRNNPRVERSAALALRRSAVSVMQFMRVLRESQHPARRLFHDPEQMINWLAEVLTPAEILRVREFILADEMPMLSTRLR